MSSAVQWEGEKERIRGSQFGFAKFALDTSRTRNTHIYTRTYIHTHDTHTHHTRTLSSPTLRPPEKRSLRTCASRSLYDRFRSNVEGVCNNDGVHLPRVRRNCSLLTCSAKHKIQTQLTARFCTSRRTLTISDSEISTSSLRKRIRADHDRSNSEDLGFAESCLFFGGRRKWPPHSSVVCYT